MSDLVVPTRKDLLSLLNGAKVVPFSPNFISIDSPRSEFTFNNEFDPSSGYVLSQEVRVLPGEEWSTLFQRIPPTLAFIRGAVRDAIHSNKVFSGLDKQTQALYWAGFLDKEGSQVDRIATLKRKIKDGQPLFKAIYLFPTDRCNLGCLYCNVENNMPEEYRHGSMSIQVAKRSIDLFVENLQGSDLGSEGRNLYVSFYGGEPLMNLPTLKFAVGYAKERFRQAGLEEKTKVCLMTNGTLITKDIAKFIADSDLNVTLSIDGLQRHHDAMRVSQCDAKAGSFSKALRGYNLIRKNSKVMILCTVGNHNIDDLEDIAGYFAKDLEPTAVEFSLVRNLKFGTSPAGIKSLKDAYEKLYSAYAILRDKSISENNFSRRILAFANKRIYSYNFSRCGDALYVAPNGGVYACDSYLGMKKETRVSCDTPLSKIKTDETIRAWTERHPFNIPGCTQCNSLPICGGGCPYNAEVSRGSIYNVDSQLCELNHFVLGKIIEDTRRRVIKR